MFGQPCIQIVCGNRAEQENMLSDKPVRQLLSVALSEHYI